MVYKQKGVIIPGKSIDDLEVGCSLSDLAADLSLEEAVVEELLHHRVLRFGVYKLWIDRALKTVSQISVGPGYNGKLLKEIGIGSTLSDVARVAGTYSEQDDVYVLSSYPGVCFELADEDEWCEMTAPIEFISVYQPEEDKISALAGAQRSRQPS